MMPSRSSVQFLLRRLNVDCSLPSRTFEAFFLAKLFQQYDDPDQDPAVVLDRISKIVPFDEIQSKSDDWKSFSQAVNDLSAPQYIDLLHPFYIHSWKVFLETIPNEDDFYPQFSVLFILLQLAENHRFDPLNPNASSYHAFEMFETKSDLFSMDAFFDVWDDLFFCELSKPNQASLNKLNEVTSYFIRKGISKQQILFDYYQRKCENVAFSEVLYKGKSTKTERGPLDKETQMMAKYYDICATFRPTDIIQGLFYSDDRDDITFEYTQLMPKIQQNFIGHGQTLVVNPSPIFFKELDKLLKKEDRSWNLTVSVMDPLVMKLYQFQFPKIACMCCSELADQRHRFDHVIIFARDFGYQTYADAFRLCKTDGDILFFGPETLLSGADQTFVQDLYRFQIWPDTLLSVDREATNSFGRKKIVLTGRRGSLYASDEILLLTSFVRNSHFYVEHQSYTTPLSWLSEHLTINAILKRHQELAIRTEPSGHYNEPLVYWVTQEIGLHYVVLNRKDCVSAKVCYRSILDPNNSKDRRRKFGENLTGFTERGMRCDSVEQLPARLEALAFSEPFYGVIQKDVWEKWPDSKPLSVKTIWFLCREYLQKFVVGYRDDKMAAFFSRCSKALQDMLSSQIELKNLSQMLLDEGENVSNILLQYHVILCTAKNLGYIDHYTLSDADQETIRGRNTRLQDLRRAMAKRHLTDGEEAKILAYLTEPLGRNKTSRCVKESLLLIGLIRLYTGMPLREVLALQWKHFYRDPETGGYSMIVCQQIRDDGTCAGYGSFRDRWKLRKIPLHPEVTSSLLARLQWLHNSLHFTVEETLSQPIILALEPNRNRRKCAWRHCDIATGRKATRAILEKAEIPEFKILLPGADDHFEHDLNAYRGDLFYANFLHRAIHTCGFSMGQRCYVTGVDPADTFSGNYVDFANSIVQYQMIRKLNRWVTEKGSDDAESGVILYQLIPGQGKLEAQSKPGLCTSVEADLTRNNTAGILKVIVDSEYGAELTVKQFRTGG